MRKNNTFEINVKNGLYVGDICYALDNKIYREVWGGANYEDGAYKDPKTGLEFAMVSTAYGDGCYNGFPVDAGNIGIVDLGICTRRSADELEEDEYGVILKDFAGIATISYDDGTIVVSAGDQDFVIETADEEDDDEEDDWWEDDWDESEDDEEEEDD